jgi:ABC-type glutathione transport system ATPase component
MTPASARPLLEVSRLTKRYGDSLVVDDVSFAVERGGSLGIVGESGSGKTTVARMLTGLVAPSSGTIVFDGADRSLPPRTTADRRRRAAEIQIVFQDPYASLDRRQSAAASLEEILGLRRVPAGDRETRIAEIAELVGLDDRQMQALPRDLSGGQRQRVAIARALATSPQLLILDESVAALDVSVQAQVLNTLRDVEEATGMAIVFITHDLAVVRHMVDDVIVMRQGVVVERGSAEAVLDDPQHDYTRLLRSSIPGPGWKPQRRTDEAAP